MAKDLVCGMEVRKEGAAAISNYKGEEYYFCSKNCKEKFDQNPEKYIKRETDLKREAEKTLSETQVQKLERIDLPIDRKSVV